MPISAVGPMLHSTARKPSLLSFRDPAPVEVLNEAGPSQFFLTCEHAGRAVPESLGDLGVSVADMDRHIAYDVGAEGLARCLSAELEAALVLQRYSRLVVDANRPFEAPDCVPEASDGTPIPANAGLDGPARRQRFEEIHRPFHAAVSRLLDQRAGENRPTILVSVHSFTPRLARGSDRPWHLGALSNRDSGFAKRFLDAFGQANPSIPVAHNEPYVVSDASDYTIPIHGEKRALPHLLLEIRNDLISDAQGQRRWSSLVAQALLAAATPNWTRTDPHGR